MVRGKESGLENCQGTEEMIEKIIVMGRKGVYMYI